jgi:pimeloyl-ACP methyl ester carboxylesterase
MCALLPVDGTVRGREAPRGLEFRQLSETVGGTLPFEALVGSVSFTGGDGQRVSAHHLGGSGELLVLAHAAGFCGGAYAPMAAALADRFEVWALDLRGHGDSPAPAGGDFSWQAMARDVLTVVHGLDRGPAVFFGHSLGGGAGMRAEAMQPGTFSAIYVYEPAVLPDLEGVGAMSTVMGRLARQRRAIFASREEAVARLGSRPPYDAMCAEALRAYVEHGTRNGGEAGYRLKCAPDAEAAVYEAASKITVDQIVGVSVPVMIGIGERERGLPAAAAPMLLSALPDAASESYPGLGHLGPLENPALVAAHVARHLGRGLAG